VLPREYIVEILDFSENQKILRMPTFRCETFNVHTIAKNLQCNKDKDSSLVQNLSTPPKPGKIDVDTQSKDISFTC
jgi:hypothetical protein